MVATFPLCAEIKTPGPGSRAWASVDGDRKISSAIPAIP